MCGRYSLIADLGELARRFEFDGDWLIFESAYNVAPTQEVLTEKELDFIINFGIKYRFEQHAPPDN